MNYQIYNADNLEILKDIPDKSIDAVVSDPPYEYLDHKLDKVNENKLELVKEFQRIVKDTGFVVMFGRGTAFYEYNVLLAQNGFKFKEEVIWDKRMMSSPYLPLSRIHETISIYGKKQAKIRKCRVPVEEIADNKTIDNIFRMILSTIKNKKGKQELIDYIVNDYQLDYNRVGKNKHHITTEINIRNADRGIIAFNTIIKGYIEQSIISMTSEHYQYQHPTQKPVRLMERLIQLVTDEEMTVLDPFMGGGSTGIACLNLNRHFIGIEIDAEYFKTAEKRLQDANNLWTENNSIK